MNMNVKKEERGKGKRLSQWESEDGISEEEERGEEFPIKGEINQEETVCSRKK
jgi:hypothetical protein